MSAIINPFAFGAGGGIGLPVTDDFNRADSATTLNTSSSGHTWVAEAGTWGIDTNQAYLPTPTTDARVLVETGASDCTIEVTLATIGNRPGISFRYVDLNNYWVVHRVGGLGYLILKRVAGSWTTVHTEAMSTANGDVLKVVLSGSSIEFWVNAVLKTTLTGQTDHQTATQHGLYHETGSEPARWENFSIT